MSVCGDCCGALRADFALERLMYKHETAAWSVKFSRSWIVKSQPVYLGVRCGFAVLMIAILFWSWGDMAVDNDWNFWWIYLTHWTLLVQCFYLCFAAFTTFKLGSEDVTEPAETDTAPDQSKAPWWVVATWMLHDIALPGSFLVFVLYWGLVFSPPLTSALSPMTHGLNFFVMLVDTILSSQPIYYMHGLWFLIYGLIYITFTILFHLGKGTNEEDDKFVYSSLDWGTDAGGSAILVVVIVFFIIPLVYLMMWTIVYVRTKKSSLVVRVPMAESGLMERPSKQSVANL